MSKQRLTITLSKSTLDKVDALIDDKQIRSRSHSIETLLQQALQPDIKLAVILAGGDANQYQQIRPLTKIDGKPLIVFTLEHLISFGVEHVFILTNQHGKKIRQAVERYQPAVNLTWIEEKQPLGTAGALSNTAELIDQPFYCLHGDVLTNIDLQKLAEFHEREQAAATIAVKPRVPHKSYDNVFIQGSQVVDFQPKQEGQTVSIVNSGVYLFDPDIFNYIPDKTPSMLEQDVFPKLSRTDKLFAYAFQGIWYDVSSDQTYKQAIKKLSTK